MSYLFVFAYVACASTPLSIVAQLLASCSSKIAYSCLSKIHILACRPGMSWAYYHCRTDEWCELMESLGYNEIEILQLDANACGAKPHCFRRKQKHIICGACQKIIGWTIYERLRDLPDSQKLLEQANRDDQMESSRGDSRPSRSRSPSESVDRSRIGRPHQQPPIDGDPQPRRSSPATIREPTTHQPRISHPEGPEPPRCSPHATPSDSPERAKHISDHTLGNEVLRRLQERSSRQ